MSPYQIEHNVPMPSRRAGRYPFPNMGIGDSFTVPVEMEKQARAAATYFSRKNPEYRFTGKKTETGLRIWRIPADA